MILTTTSWVIIISIFIAFSVIIYLTFKGALGVQYTFVFSTVFIGLILIWGFIQSDPTTIPTWIQAGATLMLLVITGVSTFAAMEMAKANQQLVQITQNQALMRIKELQSNLIIEISRKVIRGIRALLSRESQFLDSGYYITLYSSFQNEGKNQQIHYATPNTIFRNYILIPDSILQKYLEHIYQLNGRFDDYAKDLNSLLKRISEKKENFIGEFNNLCLSLPNPDKSMIRVIIETNNDAIFVMALANSYHQEYDKYTFFNSHRDILIAKLVEGGFKEEMEEYKQLISRFFDIFKEYNSIFILLYREWKAEYSVTDDDLSLD
jgi:hypothetical protein